MASFDYTISSFIITNIDNSYNSDDEFENGRNFNYEEDTSEINSVPTDVDTLTIDSDNNDFGPEISSSGEGDSIAYEYGSVYENDSSDNSVTIETEIETDEEQIEHPTKRKKLDIEDNQCKVNESVDVSEKCPICLAAWTNVGEHRLCSLRCGHLFGYKCIKKWLKSDNESTKKCPQCNAKALIRHIRFIYANALISIDNSELERLKKQKDKVNRKISQFKKALIKQKRKTKMYKQMCKAQTLSLPSDSDFCFSD